MPGKVKDVNRIPELIKELDRLERISVEVGVLGTEESFILMIANVHEYGVTIQVTDKMRAYLHYNGLHLKKTTKEIVIPERSYIRAGYDSNFDKLQTHVKGQINLLIAGRTTAIEVGEFIGNWLTGELRQYITNLDTPGLSDYTIQRRKKNSSNPLIDTGRLRGAITYKVTEGR